MYYKIAAMASTGRRIILHYFQYKDNRNVQGLEKYCSEINAYERKPFLKSPSTLPYIVRSRINKELIARLNKDDHPVIVEGIHCSGIIPYLDKTKRVVIRMH